MDATDSWIEQCKDGKYLKDGQWLKFTERNEIIKQKKGTPIKITFYDNEHGTLEGNPYKKGYYLSTKWSGEKSGAKSLKSAFLMSKSKTVQEGMEVIGTMEAAFSWLFADTQGNIGFQMSGLMPKRKKGVSGFTPQPGWLSENDWQGFYKPKELPRLYNPPEDYIITANNNLNLFGKASPINISMGPYRANRIKQLIEKNKKHGIADSQKMHYDVYSLQAEQFMKIIRPLLPDTENGSILNTWDLCYDTESKGAFLFEMVYRTLYHKVFGAVLGLSLVEFLQNETGLMVDFYENFDTILLAENSAWFNGQSRDDFYRTAINSALKIKAKKWGDVNQISLTNIVLGNKLPKFMGFDKGPFPLPGGRATIHQGQVYKSAGRTSSFAPSFRLIADMAEKSIYTNYAGGVSDRRFSKLYNNDFANWQNGTYKRFTFK